MQFQPLPLTKITTKSYQIGAHITPPQRGANIKYTLRLALRIMMVLCFIPPATGQMIPPLADNSDQPETEATSRGDSRIALQSNLIGRFTVEKFEFEGNTAFSTERLQAEIAEFTNRPISFADLLQAEAKITKLYTDNGYVNSGAAIPAQTIINSTIKVQVIEGGLEDIKVFVNGRLSPNYIRSRLSRGTSTPLNQNRLLEAMQLLVLDPRIENISGELSAGASPERSLLEVRVEEADSFTTELFADNGRSPSVGSVRRGVRISHDNLLGLGDSLSASYTNTEGSNAYDFSYSLPVNGRNGSVSLSGGTTKTEVIEPPFDRVDILGDSVYYELGFRQPLIESPTRSLALGFAAARQQSKTSLLGVNFPLSPGSDEDGETRVSALRFFQEWTSRTATSVFAARSQFSLGTGWFDATVNSQPPDSRFFSWRGQAQYVRRLPINSLLVVRTDAQLAPRTLVPLEQFGLGGFRSVRGYRQDTLLTDNGILASAEWRIPVLQLEKVPSLVQLVPFIDFGIAWNSGTTPDPESNKLLGAGLGLQMSWGDLLDARIEWGVPLIEVESSDRTWQEKGIYFSVNFRPF